MTRLRITATLLAVAALLALPALSLAGDSMKISLKTVVKADGTGPGGTTKFTGTVEGKPFGKGTVTYFTKPAPGNKLSATYTAKFKDGTISGTALVNPGDSFKGTLQITKGTKSFKKVRGKDLAVKGGPGTDNTIVLTVKGEIGF